MLKHKSFHIFHSFLILIFISAKVVFADHFDKTVVHVPQTSVDAGSVTLDTLTVLDMDTAKRIALSGNPSFEAAMERVLQARERVKQKQSLWYPSLNAGSTFSRIHMSENSGLDDPDNTFQTGLTATWVLFNGFERKFSIASASHAEKGSAAARDDAQRLLLLAVAQGFYNAQLARENIAIFTADEAFNLRQKEEAKIKLRVGTGSLSDVLNFKIQVNTAKANRINAQEEYTVALSGLAALLGLPDAGFPSHLQLSELSRETPKELKAPESQSLLEYAYGHRPDLRQGACTLKQVESDVEVARAGYYPSVSLSGSIDGERADNVGFESDDFGTQVSINMTWNLFSGGITRTRVAEARARQREVERGLADLKLTVASDVRNALTELKSAREQLVLQRENANLVEQNRDLVEKEYSEGQTSLVRLNEAQKDLVTAQSRLAQALVSFRLTWEILGASTAENLKNRLQDSK